MPKRSSPLKRCLVCNTQYSKRRKKPSCPACGTLEVENKTFEFVIQCRPYEMDFIPMHPDNGCGVARIFNGGQAQCIECPFEAKCLTELHHTWKYYVENEKLVKKTFKLTDKGIPPYDIVHKLQICNKSVYGSLQDRHIIEPIYKKLKGKDLTKIDGPKS